MKEEIVDEEERGTSKMRKRKIKEKRKKKYMREKRMRRHLSYVLFRRDLFICVYFVPYIKKRKWLID